MKNSINIKWLPKTFFQNLVDAVLLLGKKKIFKFEIYAIFKTNVAIVSLEKLVS